MKMLWAQMINRHTECLLEFECVWMAAGHLRTWHMQKPVCEWRFWWYWRKGLFFFFCQVLIFNHWGSVAMHSNMTHMKESLTSMAKVWLSEEIGISSTKYRRHVTIVKLGSNNCCEEEEWLDNDKIPYHKEVNLMKNGITKKIWKDDG